MPQTVVRCKSGHLFTENWIPGASLRAVRLGPGRRFGKCPVDGKWSVVRSVDPGSLSEAELTEAQQHAR